MILVTVENLTANILNDLDTIDSGATLGPARVQAVGGARKRPIPYPFGHIVLQANGDPADAKTLPVYARDFRYMQPAYGSKLPGEDWDLLVHAGTLSFTVAATTSMDNQEDLFLAQL